MLGQVQVKCSRCSNIVSIPEPKDKQTPYPLWGKCDHCQLVSYLVPVSRDCRIRHCINYAYVWRRNHNGSRQRFKKVRMWNFFLQCPCCGEWKHAERRDTHDLFPLTVNCSAKGCGKRFKVTRRIFERDGYDREGFTEHQMRYEHLLAVAGNVGQIVGKVGQTYEPRRRYQALRRWAAVNPYRPIPSANLAALTEQLELETGELYWSSKSHRWYAVPLRPDGTNYTDDDLALELLHTAPFD